MSKQSFVVCGKVIYLSHDEIEKMGLSIERTISSQGLAFICQSDHETLATTLQQEPLSYKGFDDQLENAILDLFLSVDQDKAHPQIKTTYRKLFTEGYNGELNTYCQEQPEFKDLVSLFDGEIFLGDLFVVTCSKNKETLNQDQLEKLNAIIQIVCGLNQE